MSVISEEDAFLNKERERLTYLRELFFDRALIPQNPEIYYHVGELLNKEIFECRKELFSSYGIFTISENDLPEPEGSKLMKQKKVYMPDSGDSAFNFVGRILGPNGSTAKYLQQCLGVKIMVRGRGSTRDRKKEEANLGKPNWEHLSDQLHILLTTEDYENRANARLEKAAEYIDAFLKGSIIGGTDREDKLKQMQLMELSFRREAKPWLPNHSQFLLEMGGGGSNGTAGPQTRLACSNQAHAQHHHNHPKHHGNHNNNIMSAQHPALLNLAAYAAYASNPHGILPPGSLFAPTHNPYLTPSPSSNDRSSMGAGNSKSNVSSSSSSNQAAAAATAYLLNQHGLLSNPGGGGSAASFLNPFLVGPPHATTQSILTPSQATALALSQLNYWASPQSGIPYAGGASACPQQQVEVTPGFTTTNTTSSSQHQQQSLLHHSPGDSTGDTMNDCNGGLIYLYPTAPPPPPAALSGGGASFQQHPQAGPLNSDMSGIPGTCPNVALNNNNNNNVANMFIEFTDQRLCGDGLQVPLARFDLQTSNNTDPYTFAATNGNHNPPDISTPLSPSSVPTTVSESTVKLNDDHYSVDRESDNGNGTLTASFCPRPTDVVHQRKRSFRGGRFGTTNSKSLSYTTPTTGTSLNNNNKASVGRHHGNNATVAGRYSTSRLNSSAAPAAVGKPKDGSGGKFKNKLPSAVDDSRYDSGHSPSAKLDEKCSSTPPPAMVVGDDDDNWPRLTSLTIGDNAAAANPVASSAFRPGGLAKNGSSIAPLTLPATP